MLQSTRAVLDDELKAAELRSHGLALSFGSGMVITSKGEAAFRSRAIEPAGSSDAPAANRSR